MSLAFLFKIFSFVPIIKYPLIVMGALLVGPLMTMISGIFIRLNTLDLVPAYFVLITADLIGDIGWYWIGRAWGRPFIRKFGKYFSITENHVITLEKFFHRFHDRILIISKLTMGFGFAAVTLFTAGFSRVPFRRYLLLNALGEFFWTALWLAIGFFFTDLFVRVNTVLSRVAVTGGIIIFFALVIGVAKYLRHRILQQNQNDINNNTNA